MLIRFIGAMLFLIILVSCSNKDIIVNAESKNESINTQEPTKLSQSPSKSQLHVVDKFYEIIQNSEDSYTLLLKDKNGKVIKTEEFAREPAVQKIDSSQHEIIRSAGSDARYVYVYNTETMKISDTFENPSLIQNDKVVYMQDDKLIISNIYDKKQYYKEITKDFSPTAAPSNVLLKVEFITPTKLSIQYLQGKDYKEKSEIIDL